LGRCKVICNSRQADARHTSIPPAIYSMNISREQLRHHLPWLIAGIAIPLLAVSMIVLEEERVAIRGLSQHPLPQICISRRFLGINCPGCGLTRSIIFLMQGQFSTAFRLHPLGWLVLLLILFQVPYRIICLHTGVKKMNWVEKSAPFVWLGIVVLFFLHQIVSWLLL